MENMLYIIRIKILAINYIINLNYSRPREDTWNQNGTQT
jgi:hypothetical protein